MADLDSSSTGKSHVNQNVFNSPQTILAHAALQPYFSILHTYSGVPYLTSSSGES